MAPGYPRITTLEQMRELIPKTAVEALDVEIVSDILATRSAPEEGRFWEKERVAGADDGGRVLQRG